MQLTTNDKRTLSGLPDPDVHPLSLLAMKPHIPATPDSTDTELDAPIPSSIVSCTQGEDSEAPTPCFKEKTIGRRYTLRQFERSVMRSPVTEAALKEILLSWEHGIHFSEQQPCTISKVESLLGLQHIDWPLNQKEYILPMKVDHLLCTLLFDHGYKNVSYGVCDGKPKLTAYPKRGTVPRPLPTWLDIPYLHLENSNYPAISPARPR